ncbi:serine hydrolase [Nakamurella sp. YIM 132087]|uniref:Serine hydrolase n=1 Tax=Nakamurella alba TaxID=2665158 RepID=A0A7K1FQL3_9ACTN|nr:serine hydrolase domain-containing protein [Nakamurella alba]MTD15074.1 serine hydrolase [Nakamurella alba]
MRSLLIGLLATVLALTACTSTPDATTTTDTTANTPSSSSVPSGPASTAGDPMAASIAALIEQQMTDQHLRAVLVKVTRGHTTVLEKAFGESLDGVPASTDMHFRNGAVAFAYLGTLLMLFVEQGKVGLDDTIDRWLPDLPESDAVTLKMLANQTSGYPDYETDPDWTTAFNLDPYAAQTFESRIDYTFRRPVQFAPGKNWSYSHTNFMILGEILAKIGGRPLDELLSVNVLQPMGLTNTTATDTADLPAPVLHSFSSERRVTLGIPAGAPFYEDSTYFNSMWGVPPGANQSTTVDDLVTTATAVGTGALLSAESYDTMTGPHLLGFGKKEKACEPTCFTQIPAYNYGLGIVRSGDWILQNPLLGGYSATAAYLPEQRIAIAVAVTYLPGAFDDQGIEPNSADQLFRMISTVVAPDAAAPMK